MSIKPQKVLVTGGAGYIGSHMVYKLLEAGHQPVIVDILSKTRKSLAPDGVPLYVFNIHQKSKLNQLLKTEKFDVIMHFAASIEARESVLKPEKYYQNNFVNMLNLLEAAYKNKINYFIFSSTAAIFGDPLDYLINESHIKNPINPYGKSKLMCENVLKDYDIAYGLKFACLRYFNAAGADPLLRTGYHLKNDTHLIPRAVKAALKNKILEVYGDCIRDYIHVMDLCDAHLLTMNYLIQNNKSLEYNLGNGQGFSIKQVIHAIEKITQKKIKIKNLPQYKSDPAILCADSSLIKKELNWTPRYSDLESILQHSIAWEEKNDS